MPEVKRAACDEDEGKKTPCSTEWPKNKPIWHDEFDIVRQFRWDINYVWGGQHSRLCNFMQVSKS